MCPLGLMGLSFGLNTSCPAFSGLQASRFSASVLPAAYAQHQGCLALPCHGTVHMLPY